MDRDAADRAGAMPRRSRLRRWLVISGAMLAMLAVAAGLVALWLLHPPGLLASLSADHRSAVGERLTVTLPDLSTIELAPGTSISKEFRGRLHRIRLYHGEAFFTVRQKRGRVFVVASGDGETTVVGAALNVRLAPDGVVVSVEDGTVDVAVSGDTTVRVTRRQAVRYSAAGVGRPVDIFANDIGHWRRNWLVLKEVRLDEVLATLERYRPGRIVVWDKELSARPVSGSFNLRVPDKTLEEIAATLPARLDRLGDYLVLVRPVE
jgi:transmembrane sensor